jgi:hypothetical protein
MLSTAVVSRVAVILTTRDGMGWTTLRQVGEYSAV